eukprot:6490480-Amphidinium_carterae.2
MLGVYQYVCDTRAPWQNGRTERSGGELKRQIKYLLDKLQPDPQDREEIDEIISQACMVRNQSVQKGGYSPMQRLFGYAPLEPMCFGSAAKEFPLLWEGSEEALERAAEIRKAALESYTELSSRERLQRAARALHRAPPPQLNVGQKVLVWRKPSHGRGEWVGPAQVVAVTNTGAFVAVRGVLWKVARECLRDASPEEQLAETMIQRFLWGLRHAPLGGDRGVKRFIDCTGELPPTAMENDADDAEVPEPEVDPLLPTSQGLSSHQPLSDAGAEEGRQRERRPTMQIKRELEEERQQQERRPTMQIKRELEEERQQRENPSTQGQVKQEVMRIEKQVRARDELSEEPPRQKPRVAPPPLLDLDSAGGAEPDMDSGMHAMLEADRASSSEGQYMSKGVKGKGSEESWFGLRPKPMPPEELAILQTWRAEDGFFAGARAPGPQAIKGPVIVAKLPDVWRFLFEKGSRVKEGMAVLPSIRLYDSTL